MPNVLLTRKEFEERLKAMSDTPRTDALIEQNEQYWRDHPEILDAPMLPGGLINHARDLERELADATNRLSKKRDLWECPECCFGFDAVHTNQDGTYSCPECELGKLRSYAGTLVQALKDIRASEVGWPAQYMTRSDYIRAVIALALADSRAAGENSIQAGSAKAAGAPGAESTAAPTNPQVVSAETPKCSR